MSTPRVGRLDPAHPLPLHAQAEQRLRELISGPNFKPGMLLPDEVSLAASMGVSRNTLRMGIARLVQEGRLDRRAGVGTRVVEPRMRSGVGAWYSFTREMEAKGIKVETMSLSARWTPASVEVARCLHIEPGVRTLRLERVRGWRKSAQVHFLSYLHPRLKLTTDDDFRQPLYDLISRRAKVVAHLSEENLRAVTANQKLATILGVKVGDPLLYRERVVCDTQGRPMEFAAVHYRSDDFALTLRLQQE